MNKPKMRLVDANTLKAEFTGNFRECYEPSLIKAIIDVAPTIDAEPVKHGRWIEKQQAISYCEDDVDVFYKCSVCGCQCCGEPPYCPNCGAKMDLKEE